MLVQLKREIIFFSRANIHIQHMKWFICVCCFVYDNVKMSKNLGKKHTESREKNAGRVKRAETSTKCFYVRT